MDNETQNLQILHIITRMNLGGTASWLNTLNEELGYLGCEVYLAHGVLNPDEIQGNIINVKQSFFVKNLGNFKSGKESIKAFYELRRIIKQIAPSIINTHTSKAGVLGRLAALSLGKNRPIIVHTFHGTVFSGYFSKLKSFLIALTERILSLKTDVIIVSGLMVDQELQKKHIGTREKRIVIFPGVRYSAKIEVAEKSGKTLVIGWLGRFTSIKRPDRVLELARLFPEVKFVLGGDGELFANIKNNAPINLTFDGWTQPGLFWPKVDIALLTSDNEAMPYSLIEAGMQGLPSVTTNVGATSEVVQDGKTGFVVDQNIESLARGLEELIKNKALREDFGFAAKAWTVQTFTPEKMAKEHHSAYRLAIEKHK